MSELPIRRVDQSQAEQFEQLGSKPKFWFREGDRRLLFKGDDRGTGEDWAEVIACDLCKLLDLPHVHYDLAAEYRGEEYLRPGVICENMAPPGTSLVLGNELLLALDSHYPSQKRFKVRQHTVSAVEAIVSSLYSPPSGAVRTAIDTFIGYIMLDAWIANQDRHHENWGILVHHLLRSEQKLLQLAPTFDHGAALGRNLKDGERRERLSTKDHNRTIAAFAKRGISAFYQSETHNRPLGTLEAFLAFANLSATAKDDWLKRLLAVNRDQIWSILERVPQERMTPVCKEFTLELLLENQRRLLDQGKV